MTDKAGSQTKDRNSKETFKREQEAQQGKEAKQGKKDAAPTGNQGPTSK